MVHRYSALVVRAVLRDASSVEFGSQGAVRLVAVVVTVPDGAVAIGIELGCFYWQASQGTTQQKRFPLASAAWKSTLAAVSIGDVSSNFKTRQSQVWRQAHQTIS
nr:hypothetical protein [Xylella fastidiosa]